MKKVVAILIAFAIVIVNISLVKAEAADDVTSYNEVETFDVYTYIADNILSSDTVSGKNFSYYYNNVKPAAEIYLDAVTPKFLASVGTWEAVNLALSPDDVASKAIDAKGYYMTVILSMLQASYESDTILNKLVSSEDKSKVGLYNGFSGMFKELTKIDLDDFLQQGSWSAEEIDMIKDAQKEFLEQNEFIAAGQLASDIIDMVELAQKPYEYVDKFIQYCNIYEMSNEWKECLRAMYDKTDKNGSPLCQALETLIYASEDLNNAVYQIWTDGSTEIANEFYKFAVKEMISVVTDACPLIKGMKIGQAIGKNVSNLLFSTDKVIEEYYVIRAFCQVSELFDSVFDDVINEYKLNKTPDNAQKFLTYLEMYFQILYTGNDFGQDFTDVLCTKGIVNLFAQSQTEYEEASAQIKSISEYAKNAYKMLSTNWIFDLYNDNPDMYEIYAKVMGDVIDYLPVSSVEFEREAVEWGLKDFDPQGYKCVVYPENAACKDLIYSTSDSSVAQITNSGLLLINGIGHCTITATSVEGEDIFDTLDVTVIEKGGADSREQTIFPITSTAPEPSSKDFSFNKGIIYGYHGDGTAITIPDEIDGRAVTGIGYECFAWSDWRFSSITIPTSIINIEQGAFYRCYGETSLKTCGDMRIIGNEAFQKSAIQSVEIGGSILSIGLKAFCNCVQLTEVKIQGSVEAIEDYAFKDCTSLTSVCISGGIGHIDDEAFAGCTSLTSIKILGDVTSIDDWAFSKCSDFLTIYSIPGSYIETYAKQHSINFVAITDADDSTDDDPVVTKTTLSDESSDISLEGTFPNGTKLDVVEDKSSVTDGLVRYNITLRNSDGAEVQPIGNVTVKIPVPDGWNGEWCYVVRVEQDGSYTNMNAVYSDGFMVFTTNHFSDYILHSGLPPVPVEVSSVTIKKTPTKTSYIKGTDLKLDGGVITVLYTDGSSEDMEMSADGVTVSGFNKNIIGTQTISVTYDGKSAEFTVKVSRPSSGSSGSGGSGGSGGSSSGGSVGSWRDDYSDDTEHTHRFGEWVTTESATCRTEGERVRTCSICDEKETGRIPITDHNYFETAGYPAKGLNVAYSDFMCVYCLITKREYAVTAGDVDGNGVINSLDAAKIIIASVNGEKIDPAAADISGDGKVNSLDAVIILRMIVGL